MKLTAVVWTEKCWCIILFIVQQTVGKALCIICKHILTICGTVTIVDITAKKIHRRIIRNNGWRELTQHYVNLVRQNPDLFQDLDFMSRTGTHQSDYPAV